MPEIVYPTPDGEGNERTWDVVFPIWKIDADDNDWRVIDQILESVAMNNRFGKNTPIEEQHRIIASINEQFEKFLQENLEKLQQLPNVKKADSNLEIPEHQAIDDLLKERSRLFAAYGRWRWYIDHVFANLGGAYRQYK